MKPYYSDISNDFQVDPWSKDLSLSINERAVRDSIINLILTNKQERPYQPNVGCDISGSLFELMDAALEHSTKLAVEEVISNWEPRAAIEEVRVIPDPDSYSLDVTIKYKIISDLNLIRTLNFSIPV